jgi:hypothetical protein
MMLTVVSAGWSMWSGYREPALPPRIDSMEWLLSPIEWRSWERLPYLDTDLNCIHSSPDGKHIWLVGDGGLILHSSDGGATWRQVLDKQLQESRMEIFPFPKPEAPAAAPAPAPTSARTHRRISPPPSHSGIPSDKLRGHADPFDSATSQLFAQIPPEVPADGKSAPAEPIAAKNGENDPKGDESSVVTEYRNWHAVFSGPETTRVWLLGVDHSLFMSADAGQTWNRVEAPGIPANSELQEVLSGGVKPETIYLEKTMLGLGSEVLVFSMDGTFTQPAKRITPLGKPGSISEDDPIGTRTDYAEIWDAADPPLHCWVLAQDVDNVDYKYPNDKSLCYNLDGYEWLAGTDGRLSRRPRNNRNKLEVLIEGSREEGKPLHCVWFPPQGSTAPRWVCGAEGLLMRSTDGGRTWAHRTRTPRHRGKDTLGRLVLPPPWVYPALLVCLGWLVTERWRKRAIEVIAQAELASRNHDGPRQAVHTLGLTSDAAIDRFEQDRLGFARIAQGLSSFLRNRDTEPPLSIAITGPWGSGKSSIMNMLRSDLERQDFPVVWFNAWHHQQEVSLLAALLQNLNLQAIWPWYTPKGIQLRWQLIRRKFRSTETLILLLLFSLFLGWWLTLESGAVESAASSTVPPAASSGWDLLPFWPAGSVPNNTSYLTWLLSAGGLGSFVVLLRQFLTAANWLGVDPARLIHGQEGKSTATTRDQIGFRYQFAADYKRLTTILKDAFQTRITVFIDDLDRCQPQQVGEVLEAVNFLLHSGECFVVLGMDEQRVKDCVGLAFRDSLYGIAGLDDPSDQNHAAAARRVKEFAERYMEKLVNLTVPVPQADDPSIRRLLSEDEPVSATTVPNRTSEATKPAARRRSLARNRAAWRWGLTVAGIAMMFMTGKWLATPVEMNEVVVVPETIPEPKVTRHRINIGGLEIVARQQRDEWNIDFESNYHLIENEPIPIMPSETSPPDPANPPDIAAEVPADESVSKPSRYAPPTEILYQARLFGQIFTVGRRDGMLTIDAELDRVLKQAPAPERFIAGGNVDWYADVQAPGPQSAVTHWWESGAAYLVMVIVLGLATGLAWGLVRERPEWLVTDPPSFRQALDLWFSVYRQGRDSPRAVKRFSNHVRFLAARVQPDPLKPAEIPLESVVAIISLEDFTRRIGKLDPVLKEQAEARQRTWYDDVETQRRTNKSAKSTTGDASQPKALEVIEQTLKQHKTAFPKTWPPSREAVAQVAAMLPAE